MPGHFRKLLVRFEKKAANYLALVQLACAVIVWRKLIQVHCKFWDRLLAFPGRVTAFTLRAYTVTLPGTQVGMPS